MKKNNKNNSRSCLTDDINILHYISDIQNAIAIDLRENEDFLIKHIPNTINIPYYELPDKINKLNVNKSSKIFLVCYTGRHSRALCPLLMEMGYNNVVDLGAFEKYKF